ncbi:MAG: winged helix-turn-helix transcriptional regulator [Armatimonadetes bacterium]|nr:winged helix-turn-helix transcriptional regulator [Armatimonadota bacterium]
MHSKPDVFGAIASEPRRAIIERLASGDTAVTDLAESMNMSISAISQHLSVLKSSGLVENVKSGKQRIYRLQAEPLQEVASWLGRYEPFWQDKLRELGKILEETR